MYTAGPTSAATRREDLEFACGVLVIAQAQAQKSPRGSGEPLGRIKDDEPSADDARALASCQLNSRPSIEAPDIDAKPREQPERGGDNGRDTVDHRARPPMISAWKQKTPESSGEPSGAFLI